jgi:4-methylaminobutanoate oxidase (formaldehyde-forming)
MTPTRSHYWVTAPSKAYGGEFPVVLLPDCKAYMRPEVGGMVVGVQERYSATFDARELPDDINSFSPTRGEEHWDVIAEAMEAISRFFPTVLQAEFSSYVSGLSTYTPDGQILLGAVPGVRNLYAAAGCCGNGVALSAGIGSAISALVRNEEPAFDIAPFAPTRFGFVDPFAQEFRDLCAAARAAKSSDVAHSSS